MSPHPIWKYNRQTVIRKAVLIQNAISLNGNGAQFEEIARLHWVCLPSSIDRKSFKHNHLKSSTGLSLHYCIPPYPLKYARPSSIFICAGCPSNRKQPALKDLGEKYNRSPSSILCLAASTVLLS